MKKKATILSIFAVLVAVILATPLHSVEIKTSSATAAPRYGDGLLVSVRVSGGDGTVFDPGDRVKLTFQTSEDAYVVLYNIDSDGFVNLLYPRDGVLERSKGNTVHFLPENGSGQIWSADDATGVEYIHAIAVKDRELIREEELEYLAGDRRRSEGDRLRIDGDPYLAFNMIDENIVVGARDNPPATDHAYFFINREVGYPRYLCTKCHAPDKLSDPYNMDCPEIVVERFAYDSEPQYPYPPLFDITYVSGETDDYYVSSKYADKYYVEEEQPASTDIYLSIYYSDYSYPYRYFYYPHYRASYYDPFWWDFYWYWDFGFSGFYVGYYYHYWPFSSWYNPYYYSCWYPSYYCYPYYDWYYWDCYYPAGCTYPSYRPIHSDRSIVKRTNLSYTTTQTDIMRDTAISGSALMREKTRGAARSSSGTAVDARSRSTIRSNARNYDTNAYRSTLKRQNDVRSPSGASARRDPATTTRKEIVHGTEKSRDSVQRSRDAGGRSGGTVRRSEDRSTPDQPSQPDKRAVRKSTGGSRSSGNEKSSRSGGESKQVDRSKSGSTRSTNERNADGTRKSSGDKSKKSSKGGSVSSRSSSRGSSATRSGSGGSRSSSGDSRSSSGSGKSRKR
jgi:hypothetical protein